LSAVRFSFTQDILLQYLENAPIIAIAIIGATFGGVDEAEAAPPVPGFIRGSVEERTVRAETFECRPRYGYQKPRARS